MGENRTDALPSGRPGARPGTQGPRDQSLSGSQVARHHASGPRSGAGGGRGCPGGRDPSRGRAADHPGRRASSGVSTPVRSCNLKWATCVVALWWPAAVRPAEAQGTLTEAVARAREAWLAHDAAGLASLVDTVVLRLPGIDDAATAGPGQASRLLGQ